MKQKDNSKILSNKNCLVTGATGGLGIEICRILLEKECNIFLTSTIDFIFLFGMMKVAVVTHL